MHILAEQLDGMPTPTKYYWEENTENEQSSKFSSPVVHLRLKSLFVGYV